MAQQIMSTRPEKSSFGTISQLPPERTGHLWTAVLQDGTRDALIIWSPGWNSIYAGHEKVCNHEMHQARQIKRGRCRGCVEGRGLGTTHGIG
jgi:hypothetical protein